MYRFGLSLLLAALPVAGLAAPTCTQPNVLPAIERAAPGVVNPAFLEEAQLHGIAELIISLPSGGGYPTSVEVAASSGYLALDRVAMTQARKTLFSSEERNCIPVAGQYFLSVEY